MPEEEPPEPDPKLYVQVGEFKQVVALDGDDELDDAHILRSVTSASRAVERFCRRRRFWLDPEPTIRSFTPRDTEVLELRPDLAVLTELTVAGDVWTRGADFELTPLNAPADDEPFTRVVAVGGRRWPTGTIGAVTIEGRFGWPQVPAQVHMGTLLVAQRLFKRKDAPFGIASMPSWEGLGMRLLERFDADGSVVLFPFKYPEAFA